ncbi:MAG: stalk domain-containing protein [Bacteroidota bacterium]
MRIHQILLAFSVVSLILTSVAHAATPIRVFVNGADLGPAAQGRIIDGQVKVPLRALAEALGADVTWDPAASCAYITTTGATEASEEPAPTPAEKKDVTIYITKTGSKYHRLGCRYLSKSSIPISLEDAKPRGYAPCSVSGPPA